MAKVLTEQVRLWPASGDDSGKVFGDGAPLHSAIAFDMYRNVNNLQTYVEPCFQFAHDSEFQVAWKQVEGSAATTGEVFLGQLPIVVPHDASVLAWTAGIRRRPVGENTVTVDVVGIRFLLAPGPMQSVNADRTVDRTNFTFFAERAITLTETSSTPSGHQGIYKMVSDLAWDNAISSIPGIQEMAETPVAWAIFTADIANGTRDGESVHLEEVSIWGVYTP